VRLRTQVLLVGLSMLALPVLGWESVRQLSLSLERTRADAQTLAVANMRLALVDSEPLAARLALGAVPPDSRDWYAESARWPLFVDGYADDWRELVGAWSRYVAPRERVAGTRVALALRTARRQGKLYLFARVSDADVVYHLPPVLPVDAGENERPDPEMLRANGDALELFVETPDGRRTHALLSAIAPGTLPAVRASGGVSVSSREPPSAIPLAGWRAVWIDEAEGYQVEIELPLPPVGSRVGIAAIDVDRPGGARDAWVGSMSPRAMREAAERSRPEDRGAERREGGGRAPSARGGRLHYESSAVRAALLAWVPPGTRARVYDAAGRLLAGVDALYAPLPDSEEPPPGLGTGLLDALLIRLFAWFRAGELPLFPETEKTRQPLHLDDERRAAVDEREPTSRYVTVDNDRVLGTLVELGETAAGEAQGYLLFESNEEHASRLTDGRLARLVALLLVASLVAGMLLFGWATLLSLRVRRLAREAAGAVDSEGRIVALAGSGAGDELGDLSRELAALLARSAAYTRYLETLSSRLSHELGTPLSVVRTSLENLDRRHLSDEARTLVARAEGGAERLGGIVRALLESTRLEQSVQHASFAPLELGSWLGEAAGQYAQVYPEHHFVVAGGRERRRVHASGALLQQALDKLVANACDFATAPDIVLAVVAHGGARPVVDLAVLNRGPSIGVERGATLFDASYTSRPGSRSAHGGGAGHVGLGLHLVRLIAEAHGGTTFARDRDGWVEIGLRLPAASAGAESMRTLR